jgi:uncharacterized cupredoxin-like copper-binding protein
MKLAAVGLAAGLALAAASGGADGGGRIVTLTIRHSRFSVSQLRVHPGERVRFVVRNTDPIAHELIIGDQTVQTFHELGTEAHHGDRPGEISVAAGETAETTYRFGSAAGPPLLFGCHLPGHWAFGMHGTIRVG